eukprot:scaffold29402_cov112-Isochrysis_galbana.AAC.1
MEKTADATDGGGAGLSESVSDGAGRRVRKALKRRRIPEHREHEGNEERSEPTGVARDAQNKRRATG